MIKIGRIEINHGVFIPFDKTKQKSKGDVVEKNCTLRA